MRTWIADDPSALFRYLVTEGVSGPAVEFDGTHWQATDGTAWQSTGEVHLADPATNTVCVIVRQVLINGQIPGQASLLD